MDTPGPDFLAHGDVKTRRRKLSDLIAGDLRRRIARDHLHPGDRLPNEKLLMEHYGCAKGTVREALRTLEVQGLVKMQTGPNGGAVLQPVPIDAVTDQLRTYLHFQELGFEEVYELRHGLEVSLALSVTGHLGEGDIARLRANIEECEAAMARDDRATVRLAELAFHDILCDRCPNPLLAFLCRFLNGLLRDLVDYRSDRLDAHNAFGHSNIESHRLLVAAFEAGDRARVQQSMSEHMTAARHFMTELDAAFSTDMIGHGGAG